MSDIVKTFPEEYRTDIEKAVEILKKYGSSEIYIFGSIANGRFDENSDIDIAVRGLKDEYYFKVLAELGMNIFREIDLIDLDDDNDRFAQFILKRGAMIKVA